MSVRRALILILGGINAHLDTADHGPPTPHVWGPDQPAPSLSHVPMGGGPSHQPRRLSHPPHESSSTVPDTVFIPRTDYASTTTDDFGLSDRRLRPFGHFSDQPARKLSLAQAKRWCPRARNSITELHFRGRRPCRRPGTPSSLGVRRSFPRRNISVTLCPLAPRLG
jgi:hypothetical protein